MSWVKKIFSKKENIHSAFLNGDTPYEEQINDKGCFIYSEEGFEYQFGDFNKKLKWDDITELNVYKRDMMTTDEVRMEIVYGDFYFEISEEYRGWVYFTDKLKKVFPEISDSWLNDVSFPAFETNFKTIYKRNNH